ncbi:ellis-van Creveld syndrome protein [Protopterus annectens]|uniref:ellis-van Creveld syndrome protein n=1 Tax=Protopterus annectens TaxID=7888 RepID=UPI001CFBA731|nr:ellis-van Creveld syndrome protein [Protopterus annectens]
MQSCVDAVTVPFASSVFSVTPGLMALAVIIGVILGIAAALLLYVFVLKSALIRKFQKRDAPQPLKTNNSGKEKLNKGISDSKWRPSKTKIRDSISLEGSTSPANNDVTEFALKAKVIYPINQKFRPLADGSSNPSMYEALKQAALPNQMPDDSSSSSMRSFAQDDESGSGPLAECSSLTQNEKFQSVTSYSEALTSTSCRMSLSNVTLQYLRLLDADLRQEKYTVYIQLLKLHLNDWLSKKKINEEVYRVIISSQEKCLEDLKKQCKHDVSDTTNTSAYCNIMEIEKSEDEYVKQSLKNVNDFLHSLDNVRHCLLNKAQLPYNEVVNMVLAVSELMTWMDTILQDCQLFWAKVLQERLIHWKQQTKTIQSFQWLAEQESQCKLNAICDTMEYLTKHGQFRMEEKEVLSAELHKIFQDKTIFYSNECMRQAKDLIKKLKKQYVERASETKQIQGDERMVLLDKVNRQRMDAGAFLKDYHDLLEKQRKTISDLDDEEDSRITESIGELWKNLYSAFSQTIEDLTKDIYHQILPKRTTLSLNECEHLRQQVKQSHLTNLEKIDNYRRQCLKLYQDSLVHEKQMWIEEQVLFANMQAHLIEREEKTIERMILRLCGITDQAKEYLVKEYRLGLQAMLRQLGVRHLGLATLTDMRMSRKKSKLQDLKEKHSLDGIMPLWDTRKLQNEEFRFLKEEKQLENETQQVLSAFHVQLVTELQIAQQYLQSRLKDIAGQALIHHARMEAAKISYESKDDVKDKLADAVEESVYVTRDGVCTLVQIYYQQVKETVEAYEQDKSKHKKTEKGVSMPLYTV